MKNLLLVIAFLGCISLTSNATNLITKTNSGVAFFADGAGNEKCTKKDCKHDTKECAEHKKECKKGDKKACCAKTATATAKKSCCAKNTGKSCSKSSTVEKKTTTTKESK